MSRRLEEADSEAPHTVPQPSTPTSWGGPVSGLCRCLGEWGGLFSRKCPVDSGCCTCLQLGELAPGFALCLLSDCPYSPSPGPLTEQRQVLCHLRAWGRPLGCGRAGVFLLVNEKAESRPGNIIGGRQGLPWRVSEGKHYSAPTFSGIFVIQLLTTAIVEN